VSEERGIYCLTEVLKWCQVLVKIRCSESSG